MKKLLTILSFIIFILSCGKTSSITGGDNGGLPPDNKEPTQTDTEVSKNYLREHFSQYSKGEFIEVGNTTYTFDGNGDMNIIYGGSSGGQTYKFWGMSPDDTKIAYYYNTYNVGAGNSQVSFMPVSYQDEYQSIKGVNNDLNDKMKATMFNEDPNKKEPDNTKINPSQTSTTEANKWKESVKNQEILGDNGKYKFDANGNLTITHAYNGESYSENYTFWGAINDGNLHGLYYQNRGYDGKNYYSPTSYTLITSDEINQSYFEGMGLLMHPSKPEPDYSKINPAQTSSQKANEWKDKVKGKSITGYYQSDNSATYTFDNNGNLTIKYQEDEYNSMTGQPTGNKVNKIENYTFWGAKEINQYGKTDLYGLYYKYYGNGQYYQSMSFILYNNGNESEEINQSYFESMGLIMHPSKLGPDYSKMNQSQTSTTEANNWKNKVKDKSMNGDYQGDNSAKYTFDNSGNITITYQSDERDNNTGQPMGNKITETENYILWGAKEVNQYGKTDLYGLYYKYYGSGYQSLAFTLISSGSIKYGSFYNGELEDIMLGKKTGYDYDNPKASTTTVANNDWLNKVKSKTLQEKYITIYTFQASGNVLSSEGITYNFWGSINDTMAIYYEKKNIRSIFYNDTIPNTEVWYYYGVRLDTINNKFNVYTISNYYSLLNDWLQSNFDRNGSPKPNINWSKMPVQNKDDIDWNNPFINGNLIKK